MLFSESFIRRPRNVKKPYPVSRNRLLGVPVSRKRFGNIPEVFPCPNRPRDGYYMILVVPVLHSVANIYG
ncbi:hypothetical protein HanRHA438_Chr15g0728421 [Helianthus annuus]|nr:hypothetical protein HanIR_Chr15g0779241 [Helianthus annuus]KAJ0846750.1 hypothetical protein HanRHA438_Chr15g0728421 [Helianthus annuus]